MAQVPKPPDYLQNAAGEVTIDPYHLLEKDPILGSKWNFNTRFCFLFFEVVIAYLTLLWWFLTACCTVCGLVKRCRGEKKQDERQNYIDLAKQIHEANQQHSSLSVVRGRYQDVQLLTCCGMTVEIVFLIFDMMFDLRQIHDLYHNGQPVIGGCMTFLFASAITMIFQELRTIFEEIRETVTRGFYTDKYLQILYMGKGFESALTLIASAYAARFAIHGPISCMFNLFNMFISTWIMAEFLQRRVILANQIPAE